ncbi:MAG: hypothetical protein EOO25_02020 [Comamonadaceae bacterium]|nr:MAG: hypothetical protein EOO25_02020 [Comamonadaceae bacterium]
MGQLSRIGFAVGALGIAALELFALGSWKGWWQPQLDAKRIVDQIEATAAAQARPLRSQSAASAVARSPAVPAAARGATPLPPRPEDAYYDHLRSHVRWVRSSLGSLPTPDLRSRMLLAKSAARQAGLHEVGLGFQDVYGIINAETSWVPRTGYGRDGTPSLGVAQFEPATARALGLRNPHDLVEAVHVAAVHMKEAALWSAARVAQLKKLDEDERAARLREGVSIYYNLSSRGRSVWNGANTGRLPHETRRHIMNTRAGAQQAERLEAQLRS